MVFVVSLGDVDESHVKKATEIIKYRGPDETNYNIDRNIKTFSVIIELHKLWIRNMEGIPLLSDDKEIIVDDDL